MFILVRLDYPVAFPKSLIIWSPISDYDTDELCKNNWFKWSSITSWLSKQFQSEGDNANQERRLSSSMLAMTTISFIHDRLINWLLDEYVEEWSSRSLQRLEIEKNDFQRVEYFIRMKSTESCLNSQLKLLWLNLIFVSLCGVPSSQLHVRLREN